MELFERLKEERVRLGMSQTAFGELGGVKVLAQRNYETGKRSPDANYLEKLAGNGVDVLYVVTGKRALTVQDLEADLDRYGKAWETLEMALEATGREMEPARKRKAADALFRASKAQMAASTEQLVNLVLDLAA
ncbi:helix-turn-helix domain-containing protein [Achromobacter xylosoxidans]|uniref:helix-turn-helix domain-containing protein n=1 Tax=Alcaligenes xylosoxydans xylosoxydans TaxID=85698 RepID=UPI001F05C378|nr:helix-turn-helix transcriptional regulator [Achromobacter xylosoxidans]MCH1990591.1 helix-turn-helix transcriptional regulator [Achromobacter xylosoxidans]MCH4588631.1 helix-turn-helix transcriptional regulator [Achromobacter xylosoxidans]